MNPQVKKYWFVDQISNGLKVHSIFERAINLIKHDVLFTIGVEDHLTVGANRILVDTLPKNITNNSKIELKDNVLCLGQDKLYFNEANRFNTVFFYPLVKGIS